MMVALTVFSPLGLVYDRQPRLSFIDTDFPTKNSDIHWSLVLISSTNAALPIIRNLFRAGIRFVGQLLARASVKTAATFGRMIAYGTRSAAPIHSLENGTR